MEDDTRVMDNDDDDPSSADEKIWQSFENLKEMVNNIEFTIELMKQACLSSSFFNFLCCDKIVVLKISQMD